MAAYHDTLTVVINDKERAWAEFLTSLMPWELHRLLGSEQELILHDLFIEGSLSLRDARLALSFEEVAE